MAKPKRYGITDPISEAGPTSRDNEHTAALESLMHTLKFFEPEEEAKKRESILGMLDETVQEWVKSVAMNQANMSEKEASECRAHIRTYGSYRLGVHSSGADIDTLCIGPRHVSRESFFSDLKERLQKDPRLTKIVPVADAYVPVMKLAFDGIEVDLVYAQLTMPLLPPDLNIFDDNILRNCGGDNKSVLSLNGARVTDMILSLVPNVDTFRVTLVAIKHWAAKRGIASNVFGFLGGVSWAILTARVCQLYPNAVPGALVQHFFLLYSLWSWPKAITLNQIVDLPGGQPVWGQSPRDGMDLMPIITPAYPAINSTHNISPATMRVLKEELSRGFNITQQIRKSTGAVTPELWLPLFEESDFFFRYKDYICVSTSANTEDEMQTWHGWVESRMRQLVMRLDQPPKVQAHPWPKALRNPTADQPWAEAFFVGLNIKIPPSGDRTVDLTSAVTVFESMVKSEAFKGRTESMGMQIKHVSWRDLPAFVFKDERRPNHKKKFTRKTSKKAAAAPAQAPAASPGSEEVKSVPGESGPIDLTADDGDALPGQKRTNTEAAAAGTGPEAGPASKRQRTDAASVSEAV